MRSFDSIPGDRGITFVVIGSIAASVAMTIVTHSILHWFALAAGLIVGCWAIRAINGD